MLNFDNIKKVRINNNLSQFAVANILNISRSSYAMWESGSEIFPIKRLIQFCDYFNVSIDYVFSLVNNDYLVKNEFDKNTYMLRLKEFRKENNLTQEKLSLFLNTTKSVICSYEKGRYIIATPFLYTICRKYNISADYLLGRTDNPKYFNK